ncbi:MAG: family 78 glycoside hydrolase catalytic domain [Verrucomicrobiota bacterium]|jgi:alpha-L-rhamnosidase
MSASRFSAFVTSLLAAGAVSARADAMSVGSLRCEYRSEPVGIDVVQPRLSWVLESGQRGARQTGYQVLVASSAALLAGDQGDLWDSGKVAANETIHVVYAGKPLRSRAGAAWKVRVWDQAGRVSAWSAPAAWTMGLLQPADWQAKWIADPASLTNALHSGPLNGYHSQFAHSSNTVKWVALDLGQAQLIDAVRLFPARPYDWQPDSPGFLYPLRFKIELAGQPDFADARLMVDHTQSDEPNPGTNAPVYEFAPLKARYVRLTVTALGRRDGDNYGFALAELQVLSGGRNLAAGAAVSASDSIETGAWAAANLVDGVVVAVPPSAAATALPATMFRRSFRIAQPIRRATAYVTGLGLYELRINGHRVGGQLLAPEWTDYRKRIQYQTHDVTQLLHPGDNAIGAVVGEGWYAGRLMVVGAKAYGSFPRLLVQTEIELGDGQVQTVVSDSSWRSTIEGPIRSAGIYDGEVYDARREMPGWDAPGFDDSAWRPVTALDLGSAQLVWQRNEPIRVVEELKPVKMTEPKPGVYVFDFGQNMVGRCRVKLAGSAGSTVTLRHGEVLAGDGTLYTANLRGAAQTDRYTFRSDAAEIIEPHFTYHGFRYVELAGLAKAPPLKAIRGQVFCSSAPPSGRFECSNPLVNRLMRNIFWTERANLMSTPTDCPQRDERFGWMGDIQAFSQTAIFNLDLAAFFSKWVRDIRDDQAEDGRYPDFAPHPGDPNAQFSGTPAWGDAGTVVPWRVWQNYADLRLLAEHFESAWRWVEYIHRLNPDLIWSKGRNNNYNDWLNGDTLLYKGWPRQGGAVPPEVFATAFFAHSAEIVGKMARVLGRAQDAERYDRLFREIAAAFNRRFVSGDGHLTGNTQAGYALALNFDLLPADLRPQAARWMVAALGPYHGHLSTGIQTSHRLMLELSRWGYQDRAWRLLNLRDFPSWGMMLENGATTIWERWDGYVKDRGFQDAGMNSFNHWALGAVGEWVWRELAGLNPDEAAPGYRHFTIAPHPGDGLDWVKAAYDSIRGRIATEWRLQNGRLRLQVTVPPNTTSTVLLPTSEPQAVTESGKNVKRVKGVTWLGFENGAAVLLVDSGRYAFEAPIHERTLPTGRSD